MLLGVLGAGGTGRAEETPRPAPATSATTATGPTALAGESARHRLPVALEAIAAAPSVADAVAPRTPEPRPLLAAVVSAFAVAALAATRLRRERGSHTVPWGTGSTSTRGPPALRPA